MNAEIQEIKKIQSERDWSDETLVKIISDWLEVNSEFNYGSVHFVLSIINDERAVYSPHSLDLIFRALMHQAADAELLDCIKHIDGNNFDKKSLLKINLQNNQEMILLEKGDYIVTAVGNYCTIYKDCKRQSSYGFDFLQEISILIDALQKFQKLNLLK